MLNHMMLHDSQSACYWRCDTLWFKNRLILQIWCTMNHKEHGVTLSFMGQHDTVDIMHCELQLAWCCRYDALWFTIIWCTMISNQHVIEDVMHYNSDIADLMHCDSQRAWHCRYDALWYTKSMALQTWCTMIHQQHVTYCPASQEWQWHHVLFTKLSGT